MLSVFPSLLSWSQISPLLIRLTLGAIFIFWAYKSFKPSTDSRRKFLGGLMGVLGILLVIGLWTQVAALIAAVYMAYRLGERMSKKSFLTDGINYYLILLVLAISLLFTGAGFIAFDYPL